MRFIAELKNHITPSKKRLQALMAETATEKGRGEETPGLVGWETRHGAALLQKKLWWRFFFR
jgi:hypothetical protein